MKSEQLIIDAQLASYEEIASEYYDQRRHPTCNNFREASGQILQNWLRRFGNLDGHICEVGAGDSLLAELLVAQGQDLHNVLISDPSPSMLQFSQKWADLGAKLALAPAQMIPAAPASIELLVSSLGDPYNEPAFWREAYRVLCLGGQVFFTTPAYEWAEAFRIKNHYTDIMAADFELGDGRVVIVPSWIYPPTAQVELISRYGLEVQEVAQVTRSMLKAKNLSPKLFVSSSDLNVVTGYLCTRPLSE